MDQEQYRREQLLKIAAIVVAVVVAVVAVALLGVVLWRVLNTYIDPTSPTEKKDLVQSFAVVVAGAVGSLSALAAVGNLYISRRNLEQQRELEAQRAEGEALPEYIERIIGMLGEKDKPLRQSKEGSEERTLAYVRTLTVLSRLGPLRKGQLVQFLYASGLIGKYDAVVDLSGADLSGVDLSGAYLQEADLSGADLSGADLSGTDWRRANLRGANLQQANLRLARGIATEQLMAQTPHLQGAIMPNGQKYEDWLKSKGSEEDAGE